MGLLYPGITYHVIGLYYRVRFSIEAPRITFLISLLYFRTLTVYFYKTSRNAFHHIFSTNFHRRNSHSTRYSPCPEQRLDVSPAKASNLLQSSTQNPISSAVFNEVSDSLASDVPPNTTIHHISPSSTIHSSLLHKRTLPRPIFCDYEMPYSSVHPVPPGTADLFDLFVPTIYSECDRRANNLKTWECKAYERESQFGSCNENEICIDGPQAHVGNHLPRPLTEFQELVVQQYSYRPFPRAYCVSHENFLELATSELEKIETWHARILKTAAKTGAFATNEGWGTTTTTVAAVLTDASSQRGLSAQSLEISAQTFDVLYNVETWRTLPGAQDRCTGCSTVEINALPAAAERIDIRAVLSPGSLGGKLYLASI